MRAPGLSLFLGEVPSAGPLPWHELEVASTKAAIDLARWEGVKSLDLLPGGYECRVHGPAFYNTAPLALKLDVEGAQSHGSDSGNA